MLKNMQKTKKCTRCKEDLSLDQFYKNKLILDGHSNYCINCTKLNSKRYFQRKKEKLSKVEDDQFVKMMLLSNITPSINQDNTNKLMRILIIERLCKSILNELEILKNEHFKTEETLQNYESNE
jgi:hypothetical protein